VMMVGVNRHSTQIPLPCRSSARCQLRNNKGNSGNIAALKLWRDYRDGNDWR